MVTALQVICVVCLVFFIGCIVAAIASKFMRR